MPKLYAIVDKETGEVERDEFNHSFIFKFKKDAREELEDWEEDYQVKAKVIPVSIVPYKPKKK